eukprot:s2686_g12.t1
MVKFLLVMRANQNVQDTNGKTPLRIAAGIGHADVVECLVLSGADKDMADALLVSPLWAAARNGRNDVVQHLLDAGADQNQADIDGETPLRAAAEHGHLEVVLRLLRGHADVNKQDIDGRTPLLAAAHAGKLEVVEILLQWHAIVDCTDSEGQTPLLAASEHGFVDVCRSLLDKHADVNHCRADGTTPCKLAAQRGELEVLRLLHVAGAALDDDSDPWGVTPLWAAASSGKLHVVQYLLEQRADAAKVCRGGQTCLQAASQRCHSQVVSLLTPLDHQSKRRKVGERKSLAASCRNACAFSMPDGGPPRPPSAVPSCCELFVSTDGRPVSVDSDVSGAELQRRAEATLRTELAGLVTAAGKTLTGSETLRQAGIRDGDALSAVAGQLVFAHERRGSSHIHSFTAVAGNAPDSVPSARFMSAFALIRGDGSVAAWGDRACGGDCSPVSDELFAVTQIQAAELHASACAFAALRQDGSVVTWGIDQSGGNSAMVQSQLVNVKEICSSTFAFAALRDDGRVVTWGSASVGGDSSCVREQLTDVRQLLGFANGFAAIRMDGQPVVWGDVPSGRDGTKLQQELREVRRVYATDSWGRIRLVLSCEQMVVLSPGAPWVKVFHLTGGDCRSVQHLLFEVKQLAATDSAFAALRADGHVIAWGDSKGGGNCIPVKHQLQGIRHVYATSAAFCALTVDGALVAWGDAARGGDPATELHNVEQIFAASSAFAALLRDGSVVAWGEAKNGGDCSLQLNDLIPLHLSGEVFARAPFFSLASRESSRRLCNSCLDSTSRTGPSKRCFCRATRRTRSFPRLLAMQEASMCLLSAVWSGMCSGISLRASTPCRPGFNREAVQEVRRTAPAACDANEPVESWGEEHPPIRLPVSAWRIPVPESSEADEPRMPQLPFATRLVETSATERLALFSSPLLSMQPGGNALADKDAVQRLKATC